MPSKFQGQKGLGLAGYSPWSLRVNATVHAHTPYARPPGCVKDLKRKLSLSFHPNCPSRQENVPNPGCGSPSEGEASLAVSHSLVRVSKLSLGTLPQPL